MEKTFQRKLRECDDIIEGKNCLIESHERTIERYKTKEGENLSRYQRELEKKDKKITKLSMALSDEKEKNRQLQQEKRTSTPPRRAVEQENSRT